MYTPYIIFNGYPLNQYSNPDDMANPKQQDILKFLTPNVQSSNLQNFPKYIKKATISKQPKQQQMPSTDISIQLEDPMSKRERPLRIGYGWEQCEFSPMSCLIRRRR